MVLLPLGLVVAGLVAVFVAISRDGTAPFLAALPMCLFFAVPHIVALFALIQSTATRSVLAGGFLTGFWSSLVLYLLFAGVFLFSQPYGSGYQGVEWFAAVAIAVWIIIGGLSLFKLDKPRFWRAFAAGLLYPYVAMIYLAFSERRH
jgi:hypothetical protein